MAAEGGVKICAETKLSIWLPVTSLKYYREAEEPLKRRMAVKLKKLNRRWRHRAGRRNTGVLLKSVGRSGAAEES